MKRWLGIAAPCEAASAAKPEHSSGYGGKVIDVRTVGDTALVLLLLAAAPMASRADEQSVDAAAKLADRVVAAIAGEDPRSAAALLHYPASYDAKTRAEDVKKVRETIGVLIGYFGRVSGAAHEEQQVTYFEIGGGGGDVPYWKAKSPYTARNIVYRVKFAKAGAGVVRVRTFEDPIAAAPEVESIAFGLRASRPNAKRDIIEATKAVMRQKGMKLPENADALLDAAISPQGNDL